MVEVIKSDGKKALLLDYHYPEDEAHLVTFSPLSKLAFGHQLHTESLAWALYNHLMGFLADQGVDNTFADKLVELSMVLEHQEYITFLEDLKSFVKSQ